MQAILAGVLSLGNVTFDPQESNGSLKVSESSQGWLKIAAVSHGFPIYPSDCPYVTAIGTQRNNSQVLFLVCLGLVSCIWRYEVNKACVI